MQGPSWSQLQVSKYRMDSEKTLQLFLFDNMHMNINPNAEMLCSSNMTPMVGRHSKLWSLDRFLHRWCKKYDGLKPLYEIPQKTGIKTKVI
jgi:hypothetical protein